MACSIGKKTRQRIPEGQKLEEPGYAGRAFTAAEYTIHGVYIRDIAHGSRVMIRQYLRLPEIPLERTNYYINGHIVRVHAFILRDYAVETCAICTGFRYRPSVGVESFQVIGLVHGDNPAEFAAEPQTLYSSLIKDPAVRYVLMNLTGLYEFNEFIRAYRRHTHEYMRPLTDLCIHGHLDTGE
jgi:hypothetical protein